MNKKILLLLGVYFSGVITTLLYNKKTPQEIQTELNQNNEKKNLFKIFLKNFIQIHKNLFDDLKTKTLTEENKKLFNNKKQEVLKLVGEYKIEAQELFKKYKDLGKDYIEEGIEKLEELYNQKLEELKQIKKTSPEKIKEIKEKLLSILKELKDKLKK